MAAGGVEWANMHHCAKFHEQSSHCQNIVIF